MRDDRGRRFLQRGGLAVVCALLASGAGCDTPFPSVSKLDRARVLGVRSEPVDLAPDASVTLDALLYLPPGSGAPTWSWSWCPTLGDQTTGYTCATTAEAFARTLDPDGGLGLAFDFALGEAASVTWAYPGDPAVLENACTRLVGAVFATDAGVDAGADGGTDAGEGDGGFTLTPAQICRSGLSMNVLLTVKVDGQELRAVRTVSLLLATPTEPNHNPDVQGLTFPASGVPVPDGGVPDGGVGLAVVVPESASEAFTPLGAPQQAVDSGTTVDGGDDAGPPRGDGGLRDAGGPPPPPPPSDAGLDAGPDAGEGRSPVQYEGLNVAWFAEAGALQAAQTSLPQGRANETRDWARALGNDWVPPPGFFDGGAPVRLIAVVRDTRGGIGWVSTAVSGGAP